MDNYTEGTENTCPQWFRCYKKSWSLSLGKSALKETACRKTRLGNKVKLLKKTTLIPWRGWVVIFSAVSNRVGIDEEQLKAASILMTANHSQKDIHEE